MNRRRRALQGLEEDIREHLERETRENMERGTPPLEARAAALRKFGNVALIEEETRGVAASVARSGAAGPRFCFLRFAA
ncbi:MAG: permease prefix domain 1-containing protein [Bryobacteraceae bacterium]